MFKSVRTDRISQIISDQIKEAIFQKKIKIGDKLPSEQQMMMQFKVSRVTVREALKNLEHSGFIIIKRGNQGGAFVQDPDVSVINNFMQDMFSMGNIKVSELTEVRMAIEPFFVKIAVERITNNSLKLMEQNIIEAKECLKTNNQNDTRLINLEFHRLIANVSGNSLMSFLVNSIMDIMDANITSIPIPLIPIKNTIHFHEKIYRAIKARDSDRAYKLMLEHIQDIQTALEKGEDSE